MLRWLGVLGCQVDEWLVTAWAILCSGRARATEITTLSSFRVPARRGLAAEPVRRDLAAQGIVSNQQLVTGGSFALALAVRASEKTCGCNFLWLTVVRRPSLVRCCASREICKRLVLCQLDLYWELLLSRTRASCWCCAAFEVDFFIVGRCYSRRSRRLSLRWSSTDLLGIHQRLEAAQLIV